MRSARLAAILLSVLLAACAQAPKESVELSATVARDLGELHRAHRELATRFFGRMKRDVNDYIESRYKPDLIADTIKRTNLVEQIRTGKDPLFVMESYVTRITRRIEQTRGELLAPIEEQEASTLGAIDDAYRRVQNAHSIVTAHLASIVKVRQVQDEMLDRFGLDEVGKALPAKLARLSEGMGELIEKARRGEIKFEELEQRVKELRERLKKGS